jgi:hypothetical protein
MSRLGVPLVFASILLWVLMAAPAAGQAVPDSGDVVVNEILYAPSPPSNEYIELYNRSAEAVNLGALEYADDGDDFAPVARTDTLLPPGDYVVLVRAPSAFESAFPSVDHLAPEGWDALNNGGDVVQLRHAASGRLLDAVPYDPSWGGADGASLERIDPAGPSSRASNFGTSPADAGGTPAAQNALYDPDTSPPTLSGATPTAAGDTLFARFSEPLADTSVSSASVDLLDAGAPSIVAASVLADAPRRVRCVLSASLPEGSYTLEARDVADRYGNVQPETHTSFEYVETTPPDSGDVVVNEILYAPSPPSNEFIELYNRSETAIDVSTLSYADEERNFAPLRDRRTVLPPDSFMVLARDSAAFAEAFPNVSFIAPPGWDALNNGGDTVRLRHSPSGTLLDRVPYASSWGGADGASLERIDPAAPSTAASNFAASSAPGGATPGSQNSRYDPDRTAPTIIFSEETPSGDAAVHFSEPVAPPTLAPDAFEVAGQPPTAVQLRDDSVAVLRLDTAPEGGAVDVADVADRVGNRLAQATRPLALQPDSGDVIVNELMYAPRADDFDDQPNQVEYVELLNPSDRPLTLNGLHLTDRPTEEGEADTVRAGRLRVLPPNGYAVVAAAPNAPSTPTESQLAAAFPEAPLTADSVAFLPVDAAQVGLANDGDRVRIHRADTAVVADLTYDPNWHAPSLEETQGTALERISSNGRATAADNWTSSTAPAGGTPGAPNSMSSDRPADPPDTGLEISPSPFSVEQDGGTRIQYQLRDEPNLIRVRIYDARGRAVRTLEEARLSGREGALVWNGRNGDGQRVRVGVYVVAFEAVQTTAGTIARYKAPVVVARPLD